LLSEIIDGRLDVSAFAEATVVLPGAEARAAKIEAKYGNAESVERFCGVVDDFVVQGAAEKRMGMAKHGGERRRTRASGSPQNGFQIADRAWQKESLRIVVDLHEEPEKSREKV